MATRSSSGTARPETKWLTRSQVAELLGVSPTTVTRWAREGRLPCWTTLGGHHRFDPEQVEKIRQHMRGEGIARSRSTSKRGAR